VRIIEWVTSVQSFKSHFSIVLEKLAKFFRVLLLAHSVEKKLAIDVIQ